ncbi:hypothetical protein AVEN_69591-1 [Araneus ventricosus]|uniref:Uncharacterized protein n=1 Tax=Araneus ventricosus TaxID=182803 RepID=A0A4Y2HPD9_ARAVE|nr:hypothetical protein AVEN_69591-1 [Araneus ventricosus]
MNTQTRSNWTDVPRTRAAFSTVLGNKVDVQYDVCLVYFMYPHGKKSGERVSWCPCDGNHCPIGNGLPHTIHGTNVKQLMIWLLGEGSWHLHTSTHLLPSTAQNTKHIRQFRIAVSRHGQENLYSSQQAISH